MTTRLAPGAWPAILRAGDLRVRPLRYSDATAWRRSRQANAAWLIPWDATPPPGDHPRPMSFARLVWQLRRQARRGTTYAFVVEVDGRFAGQVTVNNVVGGSARSASVGYWLDRRYAGRGITPLAVALVIDHCFSRLGLHRLEIAIRPENSNSLRVVEKLGIREIGYAPRYLHIDGDWRDHRLFAITKEDLGVGRMVARLPGSPD
ncbi:GNAT family N-acetyltransferase [Nocardioides acrostichi]|uniref:GNAT family N-acetyltransferase n=1 Tax=Nocardioides acrostichi TaxID=2784339 RepID=A0A930UZA3_9ACTN|nr:GNAT family protein [Nocardioides acrostichi]MBF4163653.1 GNAT family N-acetyltransferase [Nocardioides acrostichi]